MARNDAGGAFEALVVVNATGERSLELPSLGFPVSVVYRENLGMNIGAWEHGWRSNPGRGAYVFLQDECRIVREGWLRALMDAALQPGVGLVGESLNPAWSHSWDRLAAVHAGVQLPEHFIDGAPAERVAVYRHHMARWGVEPGADGVHLRSLVWAANENVLRLIGGFPIGANYGECIAAEIAVSRKCVAAGLTVQQVRSAPFHFVRHREWNQDLPGGAFVHSRKPPLSAHEAGPSPRDHADAEAELMADYLQESDEIGLRLRITALVRKLEERERRIRSLETALRRASVRT